MAVNNSINAPTPFSVSNGGSGVASLTAYMPIVGGTTTTGAVQSVSVGTQGQTLVCNAGSSIPVFQNYPNPMTTYGSGSAYPATGIGHQETSSGALTSKTLTAGTIYFFPFLCQATYSFTGMTVFVVTGVAASHIAMGIYGPGATGSPLTNSSTGSLNSASSSTAVSATFGATVKLLGGFTYWLALTSSSSSIAFSAAPSTSDFANGISCFSPVQANLTHVIGLTQTTGGYNPVLPACAITGQITAGAGAFPLVYLVG